MKMTLFTLFFLLLSSAFAEELNLKERAKGNFEVIASSGSYCLSTYPGLDPIEVGTQVLLTHHVNDLEFYVEGRRHGAIRDMFFAFHSGFASGSMSYATPDKWLSREYSNMNYAIKTNGGLFDIPCRKIISFAPKDARDFMVGGVVHVGMRSGILGTCSSREREKRTKYEITVDSDQLTLKRFMAKRRNSSRYDLEASCTLKRIEE